MSTPLRFIPDQFNPAMYLVLDPTADVQNIVGRLKGDGVFIRSRQLTSADEHGIERLLQVAKDPVYYKDVWFRKFAWTIDVYALGACFLRILKGFPVDQWVKQDYTDFLEILGRATEALPENVWDHTLFVQESNKILDRIHSRK
jgi:hypothetical protein